MGRISFRDPRGRTWVGGDRVIRVEYLPDGATEAARSALASVLSALQKTGQWIPAEPVDLTQIETALAELGYSGTQALPSGARAWGHPKVFFPSYAHEWSPVMFHHVAELTLAINEKLLEAGWELKDATPTNILFDGPRPLFVDHLSPTPRKLGQMGWTAYGQFIRTFLIPLCLHRLNALPLSWVFLAQRDGVAPEDAYNQLNLLDRLRPSVFGLITLPSLLARQSKQSIPGGLGIWKGRDEEVGKSITSRILRGLRRRLKKWAPRPVKATIWSDYDQAGESYTAAGLKAKETFIQEILETCRPKTVLDLGCNTGRYSQLAARFGAKVVAVDGDPACIDRLWHTAKTEGLDLLALVMDLGRPSPGLGWENGEELPFLERVKDRFEMVFALALVHHLLVRERVPLDRVISHLADSTTRWAIIEWVPPEDPQFLRLAGPNLELYDALSATGFENAFAPFFRLSRSLLIPNSLRTLFLLEKK